MTEKMVEIDRVRDWNIFTVKPSKLSRDCQMSHFILILESSDKGRPAKEIYKPKKRITDLGLEAQFSNLSTQERFNE